MSRRRGAGSRAGARSLPGWLVRVLVATTLVQSALFVVRPVTSYRALSLGADARVIGLVTAAWAVIPLLTAVPLGQLTDRWSPTPVLSAGIAVFAASCALLGGSGSLAEVALWNATSGLGYLAMMVGAQSLIARRSGDELHDRNFGIFTAAQSLGQLIGPALAGALLVLGGRGLVDSTTRAFLAAAVLAAAGFAPSVRIAGPPRARVPPQGQDGGGPLRAGAILRRRGVPSAMLASMAVLVTVDILTAYLPVLGQQRGISPGVIGALLSLRAGASLLSRLLVSTMSRRWGRVRLLAGSVAGSAVAVCAIPLPDQATVLAGLLVVTGFLLGIGQPLTMSLVAQAVPDDVRGTALAMRLTSNRIGQVAAPAAAGLVGGAAGVAAAFWLVAGLLAVAAALVARR